MTKREMFYNIDTEVLSETEDLENLKMTLVSHQLLTIFRKIFKKVSPSRRHPQLDLNPPTKENELIFLPIRYHH
jgi:hypothetical protein